MSTNKQKMFASWSMESRWLRRTCPGVSGSATKRGAAVRLLETTIDESEGPVCRRQPTVHGAHSRSLGVERNVGGKLRLKLHMGSRLIATSTVSER